MLPRYSYAHSIVRGGTAVLLALIVAAIIQAQPTAVRLQAPKKGPDKKEPDKKEPDKKEQGTLDTKPPEIKWPTEINGKELSGWLKDMENPDPVIREYATRTLPNFGPPTQEKEVSRFLLKRLKEEKDPAVKLAVFSTIGQIQFKDEGDNKEALRLLIQAVDNPVGPSAGVYRLAAIQTIAMFGPKGEGAIRALTGDALHDPSYVTKQNIARALGQVGFNETTGPNFRALTTLADNLAKDSSASVRMEALQSLMILGPSWAEIKKKGAKTNPPANAKDVAKIVSFMRVRVGDPNTKPPHRPAEKDPQVEIWARLVLMRFDPREVNDENLNALATFLTGSEPEVKMQALNAMAIMGELASKKLDDVVRVLHEEKAPLPQMVSCLNVIGTMGAGAKPAIPKLKKMLDVKRVELKAKELELAKKKDDPKLTGEKYALDGLVQLLEKVIKHVDEAKPVSPDAAGNGNANVGTPKKP